MPFGLDLSFYKLLIDTSHKAIDSYYKTTYSQEVSMLEQNIRNLFRTGSLKVLLDIIPKLSTLRFSNLSIEADKDRAKQDIMSKTNLWGCSDHECYKDIKELEGKDFMESYIKATLEKTQDGFKEFVHELVRGLGMALPPVIEFKSLPLPILRPFAEFLPGLLNAEPIRGEHVLERVNFKQDDQVPSLIKGQKITAKEVFSAFVLSLNAERLNHLVGIWTGSSTLLLKYSQLSVTFMSPGKVKSYQVNFCEAGKDAHMVASGEEYRSFFNKFSERLLGPGIKVTPDCEPERAGIIPVRPSTCAKDLIVYLQPAEQMFNSLLDLLCTPLTTLRDE